MGAVRLRLAPLPLMVTAALAWPAAAFAADGRLDNGTMVYNAGGGESNNVTLTLADLIHEAEEVDCQHLALSLEAIAAMTRMGTQQLGEARAQARWEAMANIEPTAFEANHRDTPPLAGFGGI